MYVGVYGTYAVIDGHVRVSVENLNVLNNVHVMRVNGHNKKNKRIRKRGVRCRFPARRSRSSFIYV